MDSPPSQPPLSVGRWLARAGVVVGLAFSALLATDAHAFERPRTGWYVTGSTPRSVTPAPASAAKPPKDYTITHEMKALPAAKTRRGVIDADVDKRFTLHAHRDISCAAERSPQILRAFERISGRTARLTAHEAPAAPAPS